MPNEYLSPKEAAEMLGIHKNTILTMIKDGKIPASKIGYRTIRIRREDLDKLMQPTEVSK